ncbi:hypothetical protein BWK63_13030 [Flavobacterium covae]|nr:hypothetical protein BWK63_13030 [Flavobacterium covae]POR19873.1 hypothetical protein BWK57_13445 [Flavobacterium columnare]
MKMKFNTTINGKPNYFIERIHKSFRLKEVYMVAGLCPQTHYPVGYNFRAKDILPPKIHTIRKDIENLWNKGVIIEFWVGDFFKFAPENPVISTQKIVIRHIPLTISKGELRPVVWIDDKLYFDMAGINHPQMLELAQNDGFDTIEDFFKYFDKDYDGKIIHWTTKKY